MLSIYQEYNDHLEEIFANSFDYIYLHDKAGNIIDVNDVVIRNLGYSKEEILKMKVTDFLIEERVSKIISEIKNTMKTGVVNEPKTYKVKKKNSNFVYVEANAIPLRRNGEIYAILGIGHDVTAYKKIEQNLRISEEKYRHLFNQSPFNISIFDSKGNLIESNGVIIQKLSELAGIDFQGKNFVEIASHFQNSKQIIQIFTERLKKLQIEEDLKPLEFPIITMNGEKIWMYWQSSKVEIDNKTYIQVIIQDITERKEAEKKLKESEEKFRSIAEQSFMGIIIIQGGELKYMNKAMSKISGSSVEEMFNWSEKEIVKMIHPEDLDQILNRLKSNREEKMGPFSNNSFRIIDKNGEVKWLEDFTSRVIYQGKQANLVSLVDVTDKKEAEKLIIEENKRLLELSELRKDLITRVSHELKTPMTSIYGAIQILIRLYLDEIGEEAKKYIEIGHRGCIRLKELIDNLLDISRLDAKRFELIRRKENLMEIITDCAYDMKYLAANRKLTIKLNVLNEIYYDVDKLRFRQVLTNIISNAIKNTPKGGDILINLAETSEFIDISIKDTGIGITEKEKENLFEKFGKIERYGMDLGVDIEGSGLGLYISKEIVELHGGKIIVESKGRNKGSTFKIRLFKA